MTYGGSLAQIPQDFPRTHKTHRFVVGRFVDLELRGSPSETCWGTAGEQLEEIA